jgi:hypothetical protein
VARTALEGFGAWMATFDGQSQTRLLRVVHIKCQGKNVGFRSLPGTPRSKEEPIVLTLSSVHSPRKRESRFFFVSGSPLSTFALRASADSNPP